MLADESRKQTTIDVIASAGAIADNEVDPLAAVEVRDVGGARQGGAKQRCANRIKNIGVERKSVR